MARIPEPVKNMATDVERPMGLMRRMKSERERMLGMTDEERAWRKKWLDAQKLASEEPVMVKGYYEELNNPIRRFYKAPMNKFENMLEPIMGHTAAYVTRRVITRGMMGIFGIYCIYYHLKYNKMNWTKYGGWKIAVSRPMMYPDTKDLKMLYKTKGNEFFVNDFDKSPI